MAAARNGAMFWANVLVLTGFGWMAILIGLTPLDARASAPPAPDLLFCVAAYLAIRRPDATPAALILILGLVRDLAGGGPVGIGALTLWGGVEYLRFHRDRLLRSPLTETWVVLVTILATSALQLAILLLALTPSPPLEVLGAGALRTFAAYLILALIFRHLLRIRAEAGENHKLIGRAGRRR